MKMERDPFLPPADAVPSEVEHIKLNSNYLRGTLNEGLADELTGAISHDDERTLKFHGSYQQDNRDLRNERARQKLEPAYQFMVRVKAPGGVVTPQQWLVLDDLAQAHAQNTLRLTTRQSFQFHGILKRNMKTVIGEVNQALLTTLAACGDVNRNVMCNPNPYQSEVHTEVYEWARKLSDHLAPRTRAYHEIWVDGEKVAGNGGEDEVGGEQEPMYGAAYLPRKFKIGITVPPTNDIDVFAQDLGFIAIYDGGKLQGFNIAAGGGMGMTYGDKETYPQLGTVVGFITPDRLIETAETIVTIQRDFGDRSLRKHARFKYTIDDRGVPWFIGQLNKRLGWEISAARPFRFEHNGDRYGWVQGMNGKWHLTLFIQNGRIEDTEDAQQMTGLREIAKVHTGDFRLTPNQNLIIGNVEENSKHAIEDMALRYGLTDGAHHTALKRSSMACVALPTCGLAMAESERYFPTLLGKIEPIMEELGLHDEEIVIRMTGCPNGCARPGLGEIAFTGKAPGKYNLYLGASFTGDRLNKLYRENIGEQEILDALRPILKHYAEERQAGERFGDFTIRTGYVKRVDSGIYFHD
jgi:sulfite reductase (NADPH) hemoprotein beta-component